MKDNYALKYKLDNLIPIVNPELKGYHGIEVALKYRINLYQEVDSSTLVTSAFQMFYEKPIPESADTIFNAFVPFMDFCRSKLILQKIKIPKDKKEQYKLIYKNLNNIFKEYGDLKELFDKFFDLMYSFSNLMPVPIYFNGSIYYNGKGTAKLNKDYPSEYLKNLKDPDCDIYKKDEMHTWLTSNIDKYNIRLMYELKPPYPINEWYGYDDRKLNDLKKYINAAIALINKRFDKSTI